MTESSDEAEALSKRIKTAEEVYTQLVNSIKTLAQTDHPLMGDTVDAKENRSLLLGREKDQDTTWEELWQGRLRFDIKLHNIAFSLEQGNISQKKYVDSPLVLSRNGKGNYKIPEDLLISVKVILKGFPRDDRQRFLYNKDDSLRERSIAYLFGLYYRSDNNTLEDIKQRIANLNYAKLRAMLSKCVELAQSNERNLNDYRNNNKANASRGKKMVTVGGQVTEKIARRVYAWVNDPTGEHLPVIDTSLYDEYTIESLKQHFSEQYLDGKLIEVQNTEQQSNKHQLPSIVHHTGKVVGHRKFTVAAIQNVLSPMAVEEIVNMINKETFVQGVGGNKTKAYVRVSSLTGAPFVVSGGEDNLQKCFVHRSGPNSKELL